MGSPKAVLVYGYDLTDVMLDHDAPDPGWIVDEDASWIANAEWALLGARGADAGPEFFIDDEALREICGVELVGLDADGDPQGVLLAVSKFRTDWEENLVIPRLEPPEDADERLSWALGVLGIDRGVQRPAWILASYYS